jgi:hypothetical protein
MAKVTIVYQLSEAGRKASLREGGSGKAIQEVVVSRDTAGQEELFGRALALAAVDDSGAATVRTHHAWRPADTYGGGAGPLVFDGPQTAAELVSAEEQSRAALLAKLAAAKAANDEIEARRQAESEAKWAEVPTAELVARSYSSDPWQPAREVDWYAPYRRAEAEAEAATRNEADRQAKLAAEAKKASDGVALREWAAAHGSELTKARLAAGFDSWVAAAKADRNRVAGEHADKVLAAVSQVVQAGDDEPNSPDDYEPRLHPTLAELRALEAAKSAAPGCEVRLHRNEYTYEDDDGADVKAHRTALVVTVPHEFGEQDREILLPKE